MNVQKSVHISISAFDGNNSLCDAMIVPCRLPSRGQELRSDGRGGIGYASTPLP